MKKTQGAIFALILSFAVFGCGQKENLDRSTGDGAIRYLSSTLIHGVESTWFFATLPKYDNISGQFHLNKGVAKEIDSQLVPGSEIANTYLGDGGKNELLNQIYTRFKSVFSTHANTSLFREPGRYEFVIEEVNIQKLLGKNYPSDRGKNVFYADIYAFDKQAESDVQLYLWSARLEKPPSGKFYLFTDLKTLNKPLKRQVFQSASHTKAAAE